MMKYLSDEITKMEEMEEVKEVRLPLNAIQGKLPSEMLQEYTFTGHKKVTKHSDGISSEVIRIDIEECPSFWLQISTVMISTEPLVVSTLITGRIPYMDTPPKSFVAKLMSGEMKITNENYTDFYVTVML